MSDLTGLSQEICDLTGLSAEVGHDDIVSAGADGTITARDRPTTMICRSALAQTRRALPRLRPIDAGELGVCVLRAVRVDVSKAVDVCVRVRRAELLEQRRVGRVATQAAEQCYGRGWAGSGTTTLALTLRRRPATPILSTAPAE